MTTQNDQLFQNLPPRPISTDSRWRANINPAPNCPRCASSNTKFCYYNNYSLSQPRFFCKGCRRYWTRGGSLRNVPVGGGCRKSRRSRSSKGGFSNSRSDNNPSPNSSSTSSELSCPDIDLAAVFAKFLNPGQENNVNEDMNEATPNTTSSEASYGSPISSTCGGLKTDGFDYQNFSDDFLYLTPSDNKQFQVQEVDQEGYITPDLASFDDILEDDFWLEDANLSSVSWQPAAEIQDFNSSLPPVDEYNSTGNLFSSDNWSYFDIAGFEVLDGP